MMRPLTIFLLGSLSVAAIAQVVQMSANAPDQKPVRSDQTRAPALPDSGVRMEPVAAGLGHAWAIEILSDGRMLVTEKEGRLRLVMPDGKISPPLAGVPPVDSNGQGGLLDVAMLPGPASRICLSFSEPREEGKTGTSVSCGRLMDGTRLADMRVIWRQQPAWDSKAHYGSRIVPAADGTMFVTTGERQQVASRKLAQRLDATLGKVVRIAVTGATPKDNPFAGRKAALGEIWSYGHRNIQSAALDPQGRLWTVEHGPRGGDELNRPEAGRNYGWPIITYGIDYNGRPIGQGITAASGMEQPVYYWDPVIAPSGMAFYRGAAFPAWQGDALIGGLVAEAVVRLKMEGDRVVGEERIPVGARVRDVTVGPDGLVYVLTDEEEGRILRMRPR